MSLEVESNISDVIRNVLARAEALQAENEIAVTNNTEYAVANEVGWEHTYIWADMAKAQIYAIIKSMEKRKGKQRSERSTVTKFEGGFTVSVEAAGMLVKSKPIVKSFCKSDLSNLDPAAPLPWMVDKALFAQGILVRNTPVDHGLLAGNWEVVLAGDWEVNGFD